MNFNRMRLVLPLWMLSVIVACVTVNVYFPAKEVEKKAGDIVDDIRKMESPPPKSPLPPQSSTDYFRARIRFSGLAFAQQDSPAINTLKQQIRERFPRLLPFFQKGAVGENRSGFLELRDIGALSAAEKNEVKALTDAENRDRRALYQEVAKSMNITSDQIGKVQRIFADKWQNSAEKGWWIQREDGQWIRK